MQKKTRSLLEELEEIGNNRDVKHLIESRATNIITSAINLLELIQKHYPGAKGEILERRLLSSIKNRDKSKFSKSMRKKDENPRSETSTSQ
jgi:hypothetical protein